MKYFMRWDGKLHYRAEKRGRKQRYCTDIICLDIETTSAWIDDNGNVIPYERGHSADYWNSLEPIAIPYIFMVSINDTAYYGREFTDFAIMLSRIPRDLKCIIWVHNLAFEFQFLCNLFHWKMVFAKTPHKVMKCIPKEFPNIEFRCTYFLTRLSLANWGKQIGLPKLVGDLDYNVIRTPYTKMTETEMGYCERDVLVMYKGLRIYRDQYDTLENIPLTQTGTVRRVAREKLTTNYKYMLHVKKLVPQNAIEYSMLQCVFAGGYTHASRLYAGRVIRGIIQHYDFASAYPFAMLVEKYPDTPWVKIRLSEIPKDFTDCAYILHLAFSQLNVTTFNTYIQASKCSNIKNARYDNGRVISADYIEIWITEQDYLTISETYIWGELIILDAYKSYKNYLPREFLLYLLELYHNKTALKGIADMEDIYLQSKQYINSMFGMMVTAIIQSDVDFSYGNWSIEHLTEDQVNVRLNELRNIDMSENRYFLSYSWGVYVTAYCRRNLWKCIIPYDGNVLYADTDSIFLLGRGDFSEYNNEVSIKVRETCRANNLPYKKTCPEDIKGKKHPIGIFDREDDCTEFITLGAKRYCVRDANDGKLHLTISGINKEAVELLDDDINNFKDGFDFDKDASCVRKKLLTYLNGMPDVRFPDGYISKYRYGINMRNNGYKLSITDEYSKLIHYMDISLNDFPDGELNARRGRFVVKR